MKKLWSDNDGFAVFELITLLLLFCVFLFGAVYLTHEVSFSGGRESDLSVDLEGERILNDLGAIFDQGRVLIVGDYGNIEDISNKNGSEDGEPPRLTGGDGFSGRIVFLADLDGDPHTGNAAASMFEDKVESGPSDSDKNYEIISIQPENGSLLAEVLAGDGKGPERAVLSKHLDALSKHPFVVRFFRNGKELLIGPSRGEPETVELVDLIKVSVAVEKEGESKDIHKNYELAEPIPCIVL